MWTALSLLAMSWLVWPQGPVATTVSLLKNNAIIGSQILCSETCLRLSSKRRRHLLN